VVLSDPSQRVAHGACDGTSPAFRVGTGASVTASQSDGSGQFAHEDVAFNLRLRRTSRVADRLCLREVLVDLGQPAAIRRFGARVQQLASIPGCKKRAGGIGGAGVIQRSFERDKIQDMELSSRLGEQS
jgi:hypothetical protein